MGLDYPNNAYGRRFTGPPGVSTRVDVTMAAARPPLDVRGLIYAGAFPSGTPGFALRTDGAIETFRTSRSAIDYLGGRDSGTAGVLADLAFNPGTPDDLDVSGPAEMLLFRLGVPTRATHSLLRVAVPYVTLTTRQYGLLANEVQVRATTGQVLDGITTKTIELRRDNHRSPVNEVYADLGRAFRIRYVGANPTATITVTEAAGEATTIAANVLNGGVVPQPNEMFTYTLSDAKVATLQDLVAQIASQRGLYWEVTLLDPRMSDLPSSGLDAVAAGVATGAGLVLTCRNESIGHIVNSRSSLATATVLAAAKTDPTNFPDNTTNNDWVSFGTPGTEPALTTTDYANFLTAVEDALIELGKGRVMLIDTRTLSDANAQAVQRTVRDWVRERRAADSYIFTAHFGLSEALGVVAQDGTVIARAAELNSQDLRLYAIPVTVSDLDGSELDMDATALAAIMAGTEAGSAARKPPTLNAIRVVRVRRTLSKDQITAFAEAGVTVPILDRRGGPRWSFALTTSQSTNRLLALISAQAKLNIIEETIREYQLPLLGHNATNKMRNLWMTATRAALENYEDRPGQDGFLAAGLNGPAWSGLAIRFDPGLSTVTVGQLNVVDEVDFARNFIGANIQRFLVAPTSSYDFAMAA